MLPVPEHLVVGLEPELGLGPVATGADSNQEFGVSSSSDDCRTWQDCAGPYAEFRGYVLAVGAVDGAVGVDAGVGDDAVVVVVVVAGVDGDDDAERELDDVIEEETVGEAVGHVLLLLNVVDLG